MQTIIDPAKASELYKQEWEASKEIQEEFAGHFDRYESYRKAEDNGLIGLFGTKKPRLTVLQTIEKITLEWQLTPSFREKFSSFDAYRRHRWQELNGR